MGVLQDLLDATTLKPASKLQIEDAILEALKDFGSDNPAVLEALVEVVSVYANHARVCGRHEVLSFIDQHTDDLPESLRYYTKVH